MARAKGAAMVSGWSERDWNDLDVPGGPSGGAYLGTSKPEP